MSKLKNSTSFTNLLETTFFSKVKKSPNTSNNSLEFGINMAYINNDFRGLLKGEINAQIGDLVSILCFIDKSNYLCKLNDKIGIIPADYLSFDIRYPIQSLEDLKNSKLYQHDAVFHNFIQIYDDNNSYVGTMFNQRKRSRSQPLSPDKKLLEVLASPFQSVKIGSLNFSKEDILPIAITVYGEDEHYKKVVIDKDWTFSAACKLIFEKFKITDQNDYTFLIKDKGSVLELTESLFAKMLSDPKTDKSMFVRRKNLLLSKSQSEIMAKSEITESEEVLTSSITPPKRKSNDTTDSTVSSATDSVFIGTSFRVLSKGMKIDPNLIDVEAVVKGKLLGRGNSAAVYLGMHSKSGKMIAIKEIELEEQISDELVRAKAIEILQKESMYLRKLKHDHIIEYYGFDIEKNKLQLFLEYVPGGKSD
eukprot:NODE_325_length_9674_cov_0.932846.p2 type:complete len:420 gc:universal NODE_325_length_9674_cov_0.932846:4280-3021(-)